MFGRKENEYDVMLSMEDRVTKLEADVYRNATPAEMAADSALDSAFPLMRISHKRVAGKSAECAVKALEQRVKALEQPQSVKHVDRNGTPVEIGALLIGSYQVVGHRPGGFDVTLHDDGSPAKSIYYLPTGDAVLESLPKKG